MAETVVAHTTAVSEHRWTLGDLDGLPAGYKCEIIDGVLYMAAPRPWPHAAVVANLGHALSPWVRTSRLGRILYARASTGTNGTAWTPTSCSCGHTRSR